MLSMLIISTVCNQFTVSAKCEISVKIDNPNVDPPVMERRDKKAHLLESFLIRLAGKSADEEVGQLKSQHIGSFWSILEK